MQFGKLTETKYQGQNISSNESDMTVNFRTSENNESILNILRDFQVISNYESKRDKLQHKIFNENGGAYVLIKTSLCPDRPLKFLIDTGASITLLADDIISDGTNIMNYIVKLFGVVGKETFIKTKGTVYSKILIENEALETAFHLVDRKYVGNGDGYLGYDFLSTYKTIIDMNEMNIKFSLNMKSLEKVENYNEKIDEEIKEIENNLKPKRWEELEELIRILGTNYDFEETEIKNIHTYVKRPETRKVSRMNFESHNYGEAVKYFENKLNRIANNKVKSLREVSMHVNDTQEFSSNNRGEIIYKKLNLNNCSEKEKKTIRNFCYQYPYQFYLDGDILNYTDVVKHHIKLLPNSKIINIRQYRIPQSMRNILQEIIDDHERQGIIEKCNSPYNSPAILVKKKDDAGGTTDFRFVVDYGKLNESTEMENFPIPLIDDILLGLSGCEFFSTLDVKSGFHEILMAEDSKDYTAFTVNNFQYRWNRMPFGLTNAPFTFQRAINIILTGLISNGVYVYLDDIIVYAKTKEKHDEILDEVMKRLKKHNLQLKISKCTFYAKEFEYLGHIISKDGMRANPRKIEVVKNYPVPTTVKQIQKFLGLCSYFRRFVKNFSKIAKPLTTLLRKDQPFIWTSAQQQSFDELKRVLADEVTLSFPDFGETFYVTTDCSNFSIGAMLSQGPLFRDRPIYFFSKSLTDAQRNYSTIEKELLAIVEAVKAFHVYLYGRFFILITDHRPLCYLFGMKNCGSRLFRQKLELLNYNFKIIYRQGSANKVADALSRIEPRSIEQMLEENKTDEQIPIKSAVLPQQSFIIIEKYGTILRKKEFDLLFHLIPLENDTLKEKIMNKYGVIQFINEFRKFAVFNYARYISNQFANQQNHDEV